MTRASYDVRYHTQPAKLSFDLETFLVDLAAEVYFFIFKKKKEYQCDALLWPLFFFFLNDRAP